MQPSIIMQIAEIVNGSNIAKFVTHHVPSYLFSVGFSCIFLFGLFMQDFNIFIA